MSGPALHSTVAEILERKRTEVAALLRDVGREGMRRARGAMPPPAPFAARLRREDRIAVIAELKRASPRAPRIRPGADPTAIVRGYWWAGADAVSVLTDAAFDGRLADLRLAKAADPHRPLLRKDFVIDPIQIDEARGAGAAAVLLIVAIVPAGALLEELRVAAEEAGLEALIEVHDEPEVERALAAGARIVGVNHRDLRSFDLDLSLSARLRPLVPAEIPVVAESGLQGAEELARCRAAGCDAALVGESLLRAPDPARALRALCEAAA